MIIKEYLKNINSPPKRFYLIGITVLNEILDYYLIEIISKDDELTIVNRLQLSDLDSLKSELKKDYPIIIHVDGDSVISKESENSIGYRNNLVFKSNPDQFFFYEYFQENKVYVSLTRKEIITKLLDKINELDRYIVHITFGPFVLVNLLSLLKEETHLVSTLYELKLNGNRIDSFQRKKEINKSFTIGNDEITTKETVLLSSLIEYLYPNPNIKTDSEYLNYNKEQFKFKKRFKFYGATLLAAILMALFISHFVLQKSIRDLAEKESLAAISSQTLDQLNSLKKERILKEKVLFSSGVTDRNYLTKYISDIGHTVPRSISLDLVTVKKPSRKIKPNEKINFDLNKIEISGYTNNDNSFNNWIKSLRQIDWIKQIEIIEYKEDSKSNNTFLISVTL